jgi:hypothetical protein
MLRWLFERGRPKSSYSFVMVRSELSAWGAMPLCGTSQWSTSSEILPRRGPFPKGPLRGGQCVQDDNKQENFLDSLYRVSKASATFFNTLLKPCQSKK